MSYFLPYCCVHRKELPVSPQSTVLCVAAFSTINTACWILASELRSFSAPTSSLYKLLTLLTTWNEDKHLMLGRHLGYLLLTKKYDFLSEVHLLYKIFFVSSQTIQ